MTHREIAYTESTCRHIHMAHTHTQLKRNKTFCLSVSSVWHILFWLFKQASVPDRARAWNSQTTAWQGEDQTGRWFECLYSRSTRCLLQLGMLGMQASLKGCSQCTSSSVLRTQGPSFVFTLVNPQGHLEAPSAALSFWGVWANSWDLVGSLVLAHPTLFVFGTSRGSLENQVSDTSGFLCRLL